MSYLVVCTYDLKGANAQDYKHAYEDLAKLGLERVMVHPQNKTQHVIPTTSAMGYFNGADAASIATALRNRVQEVFRARKFSSEIFIVTGGQDHTWIPGAT